MMTGKLLGTLALAGLAGLAGMGVACAATKVSVKTEHYQISGKTGRALLDAMDRKGPKHGFLTRAIAQTRYTMHSAADWEYSNGVCRPHNVRVELAITYVYPRPATKFDRTLSKRWKRFMGGVVKHEETHGRIAREMAAAAEKTIAGLAVRDRVGCSTVQRVMRQKVNSVVARYEAKQELFDEVEHSAGGNIDRLVGLLGK